MSTLPVFQTLLQDNPDLFTTEGLSALLNDCISLAYPEEHHQLTYPSLRDKRVYLSLAGLLSASDQQTINRIMADPFAWCMDAPQEVQQGATFYENMGQMLGPGFAINLFIYQTVRQNIQQLQQDLGISGVSQRCVSVRDRLFSYPTLEDQLTLLESDYAILREAVPKVVNFFTEVVSSGYSLFLVNEKEEKIPITLTALKIAATKAVMADFYVQSFEWEKTAENSWRGGCVEKLDPDEINLSLHLDWNEDEFIFFEAHHQDKSRFPWLCDRAN